MFRFPLFFHILFVFIENALCAVFYASYKFFKVFPTETV